ncbi:hypothetical protein [Bradyrhizobium murdochi]|uniref:hypothetical protein n=1 Tax=Bradyrhizobium murdochi TaxID=1038859 RepID=UPI000411E6FB|nr:hypothetical protein [Bradyrhizobium murdochi]
MEALIDTSKDVNDPEHVFASADAAQNWFDENDPEGVGIAATVHLIHRGIAVTAHSIHR